MNEYSDIEIKTAENLLKEGYKWLYRSSFGTLYAYETKPLMKEANFDGYGLLCKSYVPIFKSVKSCDEPISLESIVHPQILNDDEKKNDDLISRAEAIDAINKAFERVFAWDGAGPLGDKVLENLPSVQSEPAIPLSWIEGQIEWLKSLDNAFSTLTAGQILAMMNKWKDEQNERSN